MRLQSEKINPNKKTSFTVECGLQYYRLQKIKEGAIQLTKNKLGELQPASELGTKKAKEEKIELSKIISVLNDKFGTDFNDADKLFFDQIEEDCIADEKLSVQAKNNSIDNFKFGFEEAFVGKVIDRMDQNEDIFKKIMDNKGFRKIVETYIMKKVYKRLNEKAKND